MNRGSLRNPIISPVYGIKKASEKHSQHKLSCCFQPSRIVIIHVQFTQEQEKKARETAEILVHIPRWPGCIIMPMGIFPPCLWAFFLHLLLCDRFERPFFCLSSVSDTKSLVSRNSGCRLTIYILTERALNILTVLPQGNKTKIADSIIDGIL